MIARQSVLILAGLCIASVSRGAVLTTTDGQRYDGDIKKTDAGWSITTAKGQVDTVPLQRVKSIELSSNFSSESSAAKGLDSLRRSVDFSNDLARIIDRYRQFIAQTNDPATQAAASQDMELWQVRRDAGMIKVGKTWVTSTQADQIAKDNFHAVNDIRALMKSGNLPDARQAVNKLLDQDPANISALYLLGVIEAKENNLIDARNTFSQLLQLIPTHAPTAFDLAVVLTRENQWGPACGAMEQALNAMPAVQYLLDNTAELLHLIPPDRRNITAVQKLGKTFVAQDTILQKQMAAQHLYRWGGGWIDEASHDKIQQAIDALTKKIQDLQTDFDKSQSQEQSINKQVADNEQSLREIEQHSFVQMPDGTVIHTPYPQAYYTLKSQNNDLRNQLSDLTTHIDTLRSTARDTRALYPVPNYSGVLKLIEEDGVPIVGPVEADAAASQPATRPAPMPATAPSSGPIIRIGPANGG